MVKLEDAVIARYEKAGEKFELLVDPNLAMDLKHRKEVNLDDLLAIDSVFKDANKGDVKSEEALKKVFGTADVKEIAKRVILDGEVQLTTQQRKEILEKKRKEIIAYITSNAINPQTKTPHPPQRIENAIEEAKISIDINKSVAEQVSDIIKEIKRLIPISLEKLRIAVKIPAQYSGKANVILHKYELKQEEWQKDGSLVAVLEVSAGTKASLFDELNHLTHGDIEIKVLEE